MNGMEQRVLSFDFDHILSPWACLKVKSDLYDRRHSGPFYPIRCPIIKMLNAIGGGLSNDILTQIALRIPKSTIGSKVLSAIKCGPSWWMRDFKSEDETDFSVDIEYVFRNVLCKDMFPFDQQIGMARWLLERCRKIGWLCRANDKEFGYKYGLGDLPPYNPLDFFVNGDYDYWRTTGKGCILKAIETAYQGELEFADFARYDLAAFEFLLGNGISTTRQLMTAACSSELQIERKSAVADLRQFCEAVDGGAKMGWCRENVYRYATMIGNSNVWAKVWDDGKFTSFKKRHFG